MEGDMRKKASVPNRRYTEEFKSEAVRLALSTGGNAAAKRLGIPQSTMTNWVRRSREGTSTAIEGAVVAVKRPGFYSLSNVHRHVHKVLVGVSHLAEDPVQQRAAIEKRVSERHAAWRAARRGHVVQYDHVPCREQRVGHCPNDVAGATNHDE
jgi:transposase-like protein